MRFISGFCGKRHVLPTILATAVTTLVLLTPPALAAVKVGMEVNTAFTGAAAMVEVDKPESEFRVALPVNGDGIKLAWRTLMANNSFTFAAGPELALATERHNLTSFFGYGFSYGVSAGAASLGLHASLGLASGKAVQNQNDVIITIGGTEMHPTTLTSLSIAIAL